MNCLKMATHRSDYSLLVRPSQERTSRDPKHLGNRLRFLAHKFYPAGNTPGKTL